MANISVQDSLSSSVYALNDVDAKLVLDFVNRLLENYELPVLSPEEEEELNRLQSEDTDPGVPLEVLLEKYGVAV